MASGQALVRLNGRQCGDVSGFQHVGKKRHILWQTFASLQRYGKPPCFMGKLTISMAMFR